MDQSTQAVKADIDDQFTELVARHSLINRTMALENQGFSNELCLKLALLTLVNGTVVISHRYRAVLGGEID